MAYTGYVNEAVRKMYGIPYPDLTAEQKKILHEDSLRRAKLIDEVEQDVLKNNLKAFADEAKMEEVLASMYTQCQKDILANVAETMAKVEKAGGEWSYANQSALTRSKGLFEQIAIEVNKLGQTEAVAFTKGLSNIYTDQFLREVYSLGQSTVVKANFNRLNPALIKKTLDYPWSGAMFSDRIWQDKEQLGKNLRSGLTQSMILGESMDKISDMIRKNIDTAEYNSMRIARTETKRVTYCAHVDAFEDTGVKRLRYRVANGGDHRVCSVCKADNDKGYNRGEEPTLPRHPNCRCVYIPVVEDTFGDNELNELTGSVRGAENYEKWRIEQDEELKKAKLLQEAENKKNELDDAEFDLAYLEKSSGDYGDGKYSGIWKDDVTVKDYATKKDKIQDKKDYFESQLKGTTGDEYDKFNGLLSSLDSFEEQGKLYEAQSKAVVKLKKELEEAQRKAGIWVDDPFSQERKDKAYWFTTTEDADTVLRAKCGEVWQKATKAEKDAIYGYTSGSGSYNRPLTGHTGSWYNYEGVNKISIDYEGSGDAIRKMTTLINRSSYDFDIWLQRGCGGEAMDSFFKLSKGKLSSMGEAELQSLVGYTGVMSNFISTGVAKGKGFSGNVILNIYTPKGTKMAYAEPFSYYGNGDKRKWNGKSKQYSFGYESEMIIQRGASYTVTKMERVGSTTYIDVEVHPELGYDLFQQRKYYGE